MPQPERRCLLKSKEDFSEPTYRAGTKGSLGRQCRPVGRGQVVANGIEGRRFIGDALKDLEVELQEKIDWRRPGHPQSWVLESLSTHEGLVDQGLVVESPSSAGAFH
jgi:hypothetical protein